MTISTAFWALVLGDFRERTRRYSFLLTLLGTMFFGYLVITDKYTVRFSDFRGPYNGAWEGTIMAVACSILLIIVGFYLVKNSIARDRITNVGQTLAASPLSRSAYLTSKFISNALVLSSMVLILAAAAMLMVLLIKAERDINLAYLLSPFLLIALPAVIMVAAIAVLFESVRWLRGTCGNVLYLFVAEGLILSGLWKGGIIDVAGIGMFEQSATRALAEVYPNIEPAMIMGFIAFDPAVSAAPVETFPWNGITWSSELLISRLVLITTAFLAVAIAVPFFDRFDSATQRYRVARKKKKSMAETDQAGSSRAIPSILSLPSPRLRFSPFNMIAAELRLMLMGRKWFWYAVALGLLAAQTAVPFEIARMYVVPVSFIWALAIWSQMGSRETRHNTGQLLFSSPSPLRRQLPAAWGAGVLTALLSVSGMTIRAAIYGEWQYLGALMIGAMFVPSMALGLGTLSGSRKPFEVLFLSLWYPGTIEHFSPLDFLGTTPETISHGTPVIYFALAVLFLVGSFLGRRRQIVA
jgi:hypothetical protein